MPANFPKSEIFKNNSFGNPLADNLDPATKETDKTMFLHKGQWLYSVFINGNSGLNAMGSAQFSVLRRYAQGIQSNLKYLDILDPADPITQQRTGGYNISQDIFPIMTVFRDKLRGILSKYDFATDVECIDDNSVNEKKISQWRALFVQSQKDFHDTIHQQVGIPESPEQQTGPKPRNIMEMEMLANSGSFRLDEEIAFERLLRKTELLSEWDEISLRLAEDAIDLGFIVVQDYTDVVTGKPMFRYVDPEYFITSYNRDNAYSDLNDCGELRFFSVSQMKDYGFDTEEIYAMVTTYAGMYGNPSYNMVWSGSNWNWQALSRFMVPVLDFEFTSFDTQNYEFRTVSSGQEIPFKLPFGKEIKKRKGNKYESNKYGKRYRCKWVVGTSTVFDYGYQYNQVFDSDNKPKSSYSAYRIGDRSIVSRCISTLDDIQLTVLQFRNAWAKAAPAGLDIEWGSLSNMSRQGKKLEPFDILAIRRKQGDLLWKASLGPDGRILSNQTSPVKELEGGLGRILGEFTETFNMHLNTLRLLTAVGQGQDGTVPPGDALVGVLKVAEAGTIDTLAPIRNGYKRVKSRAFNNACLRWQLCLASEDISEIVEEGDGVMGGIVKLTYDQVKGKRIQVNCNMIIDDVEKQAIMAAAQASLDAAKQGGIGIEFQDYLVVRSMVNRGLLKEAGLWIAYREDQRKQEAAAIAAQNQQGNTQGAIAVEQEKQKTLAMELQNKQAVTMMESQTSLAAIRQKGDEDRQTLLYQSAFAAGKDPMTFLKSLFDEGQQPTQPPVADPNAPQGGPVPPMPPQGQPAQQDMKGKIDWSQFEHNPQ